MNTHARTDVPEQTIGWLDYIFPTKKHNGSFICLKKSSTFKNIKSLQQKRESRN